VTRRLLLLALPALLLGACGKKPDVLKAPEGADPSRFPRPYPNPKYDRPEAARTAP
jgi:hypothetical protein